MAYKHGVYVAEQATSLTPPITGTAGLQVIFGTAPANLANDPAGAVNVPKLCYSFAEAKAAVGFSDNCDWDEYTLCQSIDVCFRNFAVAPVVLVNVLNPATHKASLSAEEVTVTGGVASITSSGTKLFGVMKSTVSVSLASSGAALELGTDYTLSFDDDGYLVITMLTNTSAASVFVTCDYLDPSAVTETDIKGSVSAATGTETGLELVRRIYPLFGMTPGILLAPGWSHIAAVAAALKAKCTEINGAFSCIYIADIATTSNENKDAYSSTYSAAKTAKEKLGAVSEYGLAYWPCARVGTRIYYMSALIGALLAYTDAKNGDVPYQSPSNLMLGITGICLHDGTEVVLDQEQGNLLNSYGIGTAINSNGWKAWGNNTSIYPSSTDPKDRWIACRRFFSWWGNTLVLTYAQKVDNPMSARLIENVVDSENIRANGFVSSGYMAAAKCAFNADDNPTTELLNGHAKFAISIAPWTPAEMIEFSLEFNTDALTNALTGGE